MTLQNYRRKDVPYQIDEKGLERAVECWWAMHSSKLGQTDRDHNELVWHP